MEYFVHILFGNFRLVAQFGFWHVFTSLIKFYLKLNLMYQLPFIRLEFLILTGLLF